MSKKKILFITHDASRTGAPILLLNLAKNLAENASDNYEVSFLIKRDSFDLLPEFSLYKYTIALNTKRFNNLPLKIYNKLKKSSLPYYSERKIKEALAGIDVVISNTITNGDILPIVRKFFKGPILSYIHELEMAAKYFTNQKDITSLIKCTDEYLVPSLAVQNFLIQSFDISFSKTSVLNYYIPHFNSVVKQNKKDQPFLLGGVGTTDWRKSPDVFIQVASYIFKNYNDINIKFIWKGGATTGVEIDRINYDIKKMKLNDKVVFEDVSSNLSEFYGKVDVLLLTSREDPYPLVVLEAAAAGIPTLCFNDSGGAPEFVSKSNGGKCLDFLNVKAMADSVIFYYNNKEKAIFDGQMAKKHLMTIHQNPDYIIDQFNLILNKYYRHG